MWQNKHLVILIDGNAVMHRAYHGINQGFIPTWKNMPVGMVYGFASMLLSIIEHFLPEHIMVAFDTKEPTFRHTLDTEYKAHRIPTPDDFYAQIPLLEELLQAFELPLFKSPGFEADDICGTLAVLADQKGYDVRILSGDLDFSQLVNDHIRLVKLNGKIDHSPIYGPKEVEARFGIKPAQMVDFKALVGDSSDNFKGLSGCGPKTAAEWLGQWQTLDGIFTHKDQFPDRWREKLEAEEDYIRQCQTLAQIKTDIPINPNWNFPFHLAYEHVERFFEKIQFRSLNSRWLKLNKKIEQGLPLEQKNNSKKEGSDAQLSLF